MPPDDLVDEVKRFNGFARQGSEEDFSRGERASDRSYGAPAHGPNPCLGTIENPPSVALKFWPRDLGTKGGPLTDERVRLRREDGTITRACTPPATTWRRSEITPTPDRDRSRTVAGIDGERAGDHICIVAKQAPHTQATTSRDDATERARQLIDSVIDDVADDE